MSSHGLWDSSSKGKGNAQESYEMCFYTASLKDVYCVLSQVKWYVFRKDIWSNFNQAVKKTTTITNESLSSVVGIGMCL